MRSLLIVVGVAAAAVATARCGGGDGGSNQNPTTPGPNPTPATVTVNIVGTMGNGSYVPNPVQVGTNEQVIFRNNDTVVHRIIMDNGSADFGALAPGTTSQPRAVGTGNFHCTNHPSMVGSVGGVAPPEPPPGSGDGY